MLKLLLNNRVSNQNENRGLDLGFFKSLGIVNNYQVQEFLI